MVFVVLLPLRAEEDATKPKSKPQFDLRSGVKKYPHTASSRLKVKLRRVDKKFSYLIVAKTETDPTATFQIAGMVNDRVVVVVCKKGQKTDWATNETRIFVSRENHAEADGLYTLGPLKDTTVPVKCYSNKGKHVGWRIESPVGTFFFSVVESRPDTFRNKKIRTMLLAIPSILNPAQFRKGMKKNDD